MSGNCCSSVMEFTISTERGESYSNCHSSFPRGHPLHSSGTYGYDSIDYQHVDTTASMFVARFHLENFPDHAVAPGFNVHFPSMMSFQQSCLPHHPQLQTPMYNYSPNYDGMKEPFLMPAFCPSNLKATSTAENMYEFQTSVPLSLGIDYSPYNTTTLPHSDKVEDGNDITDHNDLHNKKRRVNYRKPENAAKLNAAVNALIMQRQGHGDIRAVSKLFDIPYNTLRDNYLRVTIGEVRPSKRIKKKKENSPSSAVVSSTVDTTDTVNTTIVNNVDAQSPSCLTESAADCV